MCPPLYQIQPILSGILAAAADFAKLEETELVKIKQEVAALISLDWAGVWSSGVKVLESVSVKKSF